MQRGSDNFQTIPRGKRKKLTKNPPEDSIYYWLSKDSEKSVNYRKNLIVLSRDLLHNKYYDTFNFYFSKPINEIFANVNVPHVIAYKDYLYYDDETEYLKRFYRRNEVGPRMQNITNFYTAVTDGNIRASFPLHDQNIILQRRNEKMNKLLLSKLQNIAEAPANQRDVNNTNNTNRNANNNVNDPATSANANGFALVTPKLPEIEDHPSENVPEKRESSYNKFLKDQYIKQSEEQIERISDHKEKEEVINNDDFEKILPNNIEENIDELSFESTRHDVYYPNFSMEEDRSKEEFNVNSIPQKKPTFNRRREINTDRFIEPAHAVDGGYRYKQVNKPGQQVDTAVFGPPRLIETSHEDSFASSNEDEPIMSFRDEQKIIKTSTLDAGEDSITKKQQGEFSLPDSMSFSKKEVFSSSSRHDWETLHGGSNRKSMKNSPNRDEGIVDNRLIRPYAASSVERHNERQGELVVQNVNGVREEGYNNQNDHESSTHIHINDENNNKFPVITIKNIQINQINPSNTSTHTAEIHQMLKDSPDPNHSSHSMASIKRTTQPETRISPESDPKHHHHEILSSEEISDHSKASDNPPPKTSSEYAKELMKKHYGSGGINQSQGFNERFRESTILARLAGGSKQKPQEVPQKNRDMVINTSLRTTLAKEFGSYKGVRSNTDANIYQGIATARAHHSPQPSLFNYNGPATTRTHNTPKNHNTRDRLRSNEGVIYPGQDSNTLGSNKSIENPRSIGEMAGSEMVQNLNRNFEAVKVLEQKKIEHKHHSKSKSTSNFIQKNTLRNPSSNPQSETKPKMRPVQQSGGGGPGNFITSTTKPNLKLDLAHVQLTRPDSVNGGGIWSTRNQGGQKLTDRDSRLTPVDKYQRDYFLNQKYKTDESQAYTKTEESKEKSRNLTTSISRAGMATDRSGKDSSLHAIYSKPQPTIKTGGSTMNATPTSQGGSGYNMLNGMPSSVKYQTNSKGSHSSRTGSISYNTTKYNGR